MSLDYQSFFDDLYGEFGVTAALNAASGTSATITVLDKTAGVAVLDKTMVETVKPAVQVRVADLTAVGIAREDLADGDITVNDVTWSIIVALPLPTRNGEPDGEYLVTLRSQD